MFFFCLLLFVWSKVLIWNTQLSNNTQPGFRAIGHAIRLDGIAIELLQKCKDPIAEEAERPSGLVPLNKLILDFEFGFKITLKKKEFY